MPRQLDSFNQRVGGSKSYGVGNLTQQRGLTASPVVVDSGCQRSWSEKSRPRPAIRGRDGDLPAHRGTREAPHVAHLSQAFLPRPARAMRTVQTPATRVNLGPDRDEGAAVHDCLARGAR